MSVPFDPTNRPVRPAPRPIAQQQNSGEQVRPIAQHSGAQVRPMFDPAPIQQVATQDKPPTVDSSELYTVEANETVAGNLDKYTDFETPLMKRIAQQGIDQAASRGLTNSSIASGNAIGKVLDKAGEWATTDAAAYANRKTESLRSATSKYGTDQSVEASKYGADKDAEASKYSSDASKEASKYGADKDAEASKYSSDASREASKYGADASREASMYSADTSLAGQKYSSDRQLEGARVSAAATAQAAETSANARIAAENIAASSNQKIEASRAQTAENQIKSQEVLRNMDASDRIKAAQVLADTNRDQQARGAKYSATQSAGNGYTAAIANINIESSAKSQKEQLDRINASYDIEMEAINSLW